MILAYRSTRVFAISIDDQCATKIGVLSTESSER